MIEHIPVFVATIDVLGVLSKSMEFVHHSAAVGESYFLVKEVGPYAATPVICLAKYHKKIRSQHKEREPGE